MILDVSRPLFFYLPLSIALCWQFISYFLLLARSFSYYCWSEFLCSFTAFCGSPFSLYLTSQLYPSPFLSPYLSPFSDAPLSHTHFLIFPLPGCLKLSPLCSSSFSSITQQCSSKKPIQSEIERKLCLVICLVPHRRFIASYLSTATTKVYRYSLAHISRWKRILSIFYYYFHSNADTLNFYCLYFIFNAFYYTFWRWSFFARLWKSARKRKYGLNAMPLPSHIT